MVSELDANLLRNLLLFMNEDEHRSIEDRLKEDPVCYRYYLEKMQEVRHEKDNAAVQQYDGVGKDFFGVLCSYIDRSGLKDSMVYGKIGMHRNQWYKIRKREKRAGKAFVLKLCIVLRLDLYEANYLMLLAGYFFIPGNQTDYIVCDCLKEKIYDEAEIDERLAQAGEQTLFSDK